MNKTNLEFKEPTYYPNLFFKNKHFNTLYRTVFHQIDIEYDRKRMETKDGDFIDLDFSIVDSNKIAILIHGLEGCSNSKYIKSACKVLNNNNIDIVALNLRGCSGEPNRQLSCYHSGKTDDLNEVVSYLIKNYKYDEIHIVGYSLGGNLTLKYLGENGLDLPKIVKSGVAISVPCDLRGASEELAKFHNVIYKKKLLKLLKKKAVKKLEIFPHPTLSKKIIKSIKNFYDFDNLYTAPINGFKDAHDYWRKSSCKQFIPKIKTPALLITSYDDPFLSDSCIPHEEAKNHNYFKMEATKYGGHVGFINKDSIWLENRILDFILNQ